MLRKVQSRLLGRGNTSNDALDQAGTGNSNLFEGGSSNPPNNPPVANSTPKSPDGIPMNILAFRTITTLLAKIQQEKPLIYSNNEDREGENKYTLWISNAFANLALTDHGTVALSTKICPDELQVIACTDHNDNNPLIDHLPPSKVASLWTMMFTVNPRRDDVASDNPHPTIVDTTIPSGVDPNDDGTLINYMDEEWWVDYHNLLSTCSHPDSYKKPPNLLEHLWMLNRLTW